MQYLILSFGGSFGHENPSSKFAINSKSVTHHVLDRPLTDEQRKMYTALNRELVQPQWIADCVNNMILLPTSQYFPGLPPPAHLSPFIDNQKEGYVPDRQREINRLKGEDVEEEEPELPSQIVEKKSAKAEENDSEYGGDDSEDEDDDEEESDEEELPKQKKRK